MPKVVPEYKEQARRRILEAASAEFAKKGYRKTTMSDIAKTVGVSKSAVYQYFESKDKLIGALGDQIVESLIVNEFSSSEGEGATERIQGAFERITKYMPPWFPNLIFDFLSEANRDKDARQQVREIDRKLVGAISRYLEDWKKAGELPQDVNTERLARGFIGLHLGLMGMVSSGLSRSDAIEGWEEMIKRVGLGLRVDK